jgi:hypothetical protein
LRQRQNSAGKTLELANCNWHVARANISRPQPPTSSVLCTVRNYEEWKWSCKASY